MKAVHFKASFSFLLTFLMVIQVLGQSTLNESDPVKIGWMQGSPPPKDKIISAIDGSFFRFPALRYSVCNMREFFPTKEVRASSVPAAPFKEEHDDNIDTVTFIPWNSKEKMSWKKSLEVNFTDGIIVLHKGNVVYEDYFGALDQDGLHAAMSVSKTFTGTLGALLVEEGLLDENKPAISYLPELKESAFGDATIRQILDMTTALKYSEDYSDTNAEIWAFSAAGNPFPKPPGYNGPSNYYEYLMSVQKEGEHGLAFAYKTINTDVMGWIVSRISGESLTELLSKRIWKPMGARYNGYYQIDGAGIAFAGGGFSANLRDMALFGEMIRNKGFINGKQVLPRELVEDIMKGGDQSLYAKSSYSKTLKNWSYRNMWWITHNEHGAFAARGVHGQTIYIDPLAEMVIVRFASHPQAKNSKIDPTSLPAYHAVAKYLMKVE